MSAAFMTGLIAATHTPFHADGSLNVEAIGRQAEFMLAQQVTTVFIGGSTGECHSLSVVERQALAERWFQVVKGSELRVIVHVGSNCLADAKLLAGQAQELGAAAVAAFAPSYFKPDSLDCLIACAAEIAAAAPKTPFYFYDIPSMTQVHFSMPDFLQQAPERIPNLVGLKFTNIDLMAYQQCVQADGGRWNVLFGCDELLLAALSLGAVGAVGSSYNFAAPIYHRVMAAFERGDMTAAREEQFKSVQLIQLLSRFGYMGAAKGLMEMLGVPVGPPRLPNRAITPAQLGQLRQQLETLDFFNWVKA
jgi:N-acetylneuraminate lyase